MAEAKKKSKRAESDATDSDKRAKPDEKLVRKWERRFDALPQAAREHLDGTDPAERSFDGDA